jgi:hypothetical protein
MVPQNTQQLGEKAKFSKIKRHWRLQNKMGGNATQPNAQSDTLVAACRVNAREIETLGSYVVAAFALPATILL